MTISTNTEALNAKSPQMKRNMSSTTTRQRRRNLHSNRMSKTYDKQKICLTKFLNKYGT